ncbi:NAD-binding protein [Rhizobium sp. T1470]|uniref:NAD-binding protein n=1 Tax=unclassified Rhizobium TaxID=2613769 RepID=UPI0035D044B3
MEAATAYCHYWRSGNDRAQADHAARRRRAARRSGRHSLSLVDVVTPVAREGFTGRVAASAADISAKGQTARIVAASRPDVVSHLAAIVSGGAERGAIAEAMLLLEAGGGSPQALRRVVRGGFAESRILDIHGQRMVDRDFATAGPSRLQPKDLPNITATAESLSLTLPLTQAVRAEFAEFVEHGGGETDHSGLLLQLEETKHRSSKG